MSKQSLQRRINKLSAQIPTPVPPDTSPLIDTSLFTASEQERINTLLAECSVYPTLREIPPLTLYYLLLWWKLERALRLQSEQHIEALRYRLTFSTEDIERLLRALGEGRTHEDLLAMRPRWEAGSNYDQGGGICYETYLRAFQKNDELQIYRYLDEMWHWLVYHHVVQPNFTCSYHIGQELQELEGRAS